MWICKMGNDNMKTLYSVCLISHGIWWQRWTNLPLTWIYSVLSECWGRNWDSSDEAALFQCSVLQFWWCWQDCCCRFFFKWLFQLLLPSHQLEAHSPLISGIGKVFSPRDLLLTGYFLFFKPISVNFRDGYVEKSQWICSFCNTHTCLTPTTIPCWK